LAPNVKAFADDHSCPRIHPFPGRTGRDDNARRLYGDCFDFHFRETSPTVFAIASRVLRLSSVQSADLWRGVECRRVVTEVPVARLHVRFETPLSQVDRDYLPTSLRRPVSLNRIDLETLSEEF